MIIIFTHLGESTGVALRLTCYADIATMQDKPVVGNGEQLLRKAPL
jgi:hypothetical protein